MNYQAEPTKVAIKPIVAALIGVLSTFLTYLSSYDERYNIWQINIMLKEMNEPSLKFLVVVLLLMVIMFGVTIITSALGSRGNLLATLIVSIVGTIIGLIHYLFIAAMVKSVGSDMEMGPGVWLPLVAMIAVMILSIKARSAMKRPNIQPM